MKKIKFIIVLTILSLSIFARHVIPVAHYKSTDFIKNIKLPSTVGNWTGKDISTQLDLDFDKDWNKFISQYLIYEYTSIAGKKITFILLDAGNFHDPKVCFTASGFKITELEKTDLTVSDRNIKAHALFTHKEMASSLSLYWIIIDKKIVDSWMAQKISQFFYSLFNRQRVGLMVRFDIPSEKDNMQENVLLIQDFINRLIHTLPTDQAIYITGIE